MILDFAGIIPPVSWLSILQEATAITSSFSSFMSRFRLLVSLFFFVTNRDQAMCCFLLRTTNAVEHGAKSEWRCRSMMWAKFSPMSNKLASISHLFDVNNLMQQLQK